ncbi:hypothetical protein [Massilia soli]|uniref:Uncharacterized protein n=1 Tax=Massilia soli TaxID=2792854 RepID=A0ABS7SKZ1_9BURK|nr:hypothetical protein [Massilia soli]MBZ2206860.1 hypothetical protein [Massilia soli]
MGARLRGHDVAVATPLSAWRCVNAKKATSRLSVEANPSFPRGHDVAVATPASTWRCVNAKKGDVTVKCGRHSVVPAQAGIHTETGERIGSLAVTASLVWVPACAGTTCGGHSAFSMALRRHEKKPAEKAGFAKQPSYSGCFYCCVVAD